MKMKIDAIVDLITPGLFKVEVWDRDNPEDRATYEIDAPDQPKAAFAGIKRFNDERTGNDQEI